MSASSEAGPSVYLSISRIDVIADPARLKELDLAVLAG